MFAVIQHETYFSGIQEPDHCMIREKNEVEIKLLILPKGSFYQKYQQRIMVVVFYNFREFMNKKPFEVASACRYFDIFTDRGIYLMELYRLVIPVAESLKTHFFSKKSSYFLNEEFPLHPPDVIRDKLAQELRKLEHPLKPTNAAMN